MTPNEAPKFCPEAESALVRVVQYLRGKPHEFMPTNFLVIHDHLEAEDGTVYVAGYIKAHHPNGCPVDKLTLRRISTKIGEQRRIAKEIAKRGFYDD